MSSAMQRWHNSIEQLPLVAILRGITPDQVVSVGRVLVDAGFTIIEVPLNSPRPFESIRLLVDEFGKQISIGAGTVLTSDDVSRTLDTGASLIVAPNFNAEVAARAVEAGAIYCPGVATPSEAFNALDNGASALKLFPAEMITPSVVKAMRAVLPPETYLLAVGGISPDNMQPYIDSGCTGFGIGSALFKPGKSLDDLAQSAAGFVSAMRKYSVSSCP